MNKYISLKLSKLLADNGFKGIGGIENWWCKIDKNHCIILKVWEINNEKKLFPAYDILNDLCVKYAKEMFGEEKNSEHKLFMRIGEDEYPDTNWTMLNYHSISILILLQQNKKDKAEEYLWEHCLFNPKNKL